MKGGNMRKRVMKTIVKRRQNRTENMLQINENKRKRNREDKKRALDEKNKIYTYILIINMDKRRKIVCLQMKETKTPQTDNNNDRLFITFVNLLICLFACFCLF